MDAVNPGDVPPARILEEVAARFGLATIDLDPRPHRGTGYLTFRAATPWGTLALRKRRGSGLKMKPGRPDPCERVDRQHALILFLHDRGLPVAPPLRALDGRTYVRISESPYSLYPYIDGTPVDPRNLVQMEGAGAIFARYHRMAADYNGPDPLNEEPIPRILGRARLEFAAEAHSIWVARLGMDEGVRTLEDSLPGVTAALQALGYETLPKTLIHGDFVPWNLLCHGNEIAAVLDFGRSRREARVYDLVITTCQLLRKGTSPQAFQGVRALARGYNAVWPLSEAEAGAVPPLLRVALTLKAFKRLRKLLAKDRGYERQTDKVREFDDLLRLSAWVAQNASAIESCFRSSGVPRGSAASTPPSRA